ncbi:hypothetical protein TIFTF001_046503 [Ficus carica]|uniref:Gag-pol polyprotein n=1 Tax=Ficus carica TaxID=3494 RepID=A0AA88CVG4_FICCA|nr:hypothetical protein TIFTF001_046501 [Ficus carica]GMN31324.1 hypothetical protein TIFTF001_046503 [Ficus carica]
MEQQRETDRLREQITRFDQIPRANVVPPQGNPVPPVVPQVPEGHQEVPRDVEVPLAPIGVQTNPPLIREDMLYERFRRMKAPEFEGPTDPIEADNWLIDIQIILDFMGLTEQEKVMCSSFALKKDDKEARAQNFKAKKEEKAVAKQSQPRQNPRQFGKNKRKENATSQGQQGNYLIRRLTEIECPHLAQERLEAPEPQTWNYAYTKEDVEVKTSSVATG